MAKPNKVRKRKNFNNRNPANGEDGIPVRVKLPRENQVIGIITQRLGAGRMFVSCMDGKTRNCRVPGRLRRGMWLREGDVVICEPWEFDDEKADILYKYSKAAIQRLKKMNRLQTSVGEF